jgi:hypothetical protein
METNWRTLIPLMSADYARTMRELHGKPKIIVTSSPVERQLSMSLTFW